MDSLSPSDMLRLLEDEATRLCEMEQKILNQLRHLQVEENVYEQAMKQLESEGVVDKNNTADEENDPEDANFAEEIDRELAEALTATLEADKLFAERDNLNGEEETAAREKRAS